MSVTAPTAPVKPTPPSVPQVNLSGAGENHSADSSTVFGTTVTQSKPPETSAKPKAQEGSASKAVTKSSEEASSGNAAGSSSASQGLLDGSGSGFASSTASSASVQQPSPTANPHSILYWPFAVIVVGVALLLLVLKTRKREKSVRSLGHLDDRPRSSAEIPAKAEEKKGHFEVRI